MQTRPAGELTWGRHGGPSQYLIYIWRYSLRARIVVYFTTYIKSRKLLSIVCKIPLLARRTRPKGRPSAARDDRVSCIQYFQMTSTFYTLYKIGAVYKGRPPKSRIFKPPPLPFRMRLTLTSAILR